MRRTRPSPDMSPPSSRGGGGMDRIKLGIGIGGLAVAGVIVAWQFGVFGGGKPALPPAQPQQQQQMEEEIRQQERLQKEMEERGEITLG